MIKGALSYHFYQHQIHISPKEKMASANLLTRASRFANTRLEPHFNYINSMSLKCAIQLGIPDAIHEHGEPMPLSQLAVTLSINYTKHDSLRRLMRLLVHSKFFKEVCLLGEEAYCLTGASRLLLRCGALSLVPLVLIVLDPIMMGPWHHMSKWFRDERSSSFETKHGSTFWEYAKGDARFDSLFNKGMASDAEFVAGVLGNEGRHVFEVLKTIVDVGGGTGATARGLAARV